MFLSHFILFLAVVLVCSSCCSRVWPFCGHCFCWVGFVKCWSSKVLWSVFLFVFIVAAVCATRPIGRRPRLRICILSPQHPARRPDQTRTQTREIRMETFQTHIRRKARPTDQTSSVTKLPVKRRVRPSEDGFARLDKHLWESTRLTPVFLATLVALHFTPVSEWVSKWVGRSFELA